MRYVYLRHLQYITSYTSSAIPIRTKCLTAMSGFRLIGRSTDRWRAVVHQAFPSLLPSSSLQSSQPLNAQTGISSRLSTTIPSIPPSILATPQDFVHSAPKFPPFASRRLLGDVEENHFRSLSAKELDSRCSNAFRSSCNQNDLPAQAGIHGGRDRHIDPTKPSKEFANRARMSVSRVAIQI